MSTCSNLRKSKSWFCVFLLNIFLLPGGVCVCFICKEKFGNKYLKNKKCCKVKYHRDYTGEYALHSIYKLKYRCLKKIL